jgi:hypothetical protein
VFALLALLATAACRHVPPDMDARVAAPPPPERRAPMEAEIQGVWVSRSVRGAFADWGSLAVYVFRPGGTYAGALAGVQDCVPLEGRWTLADGVLTLDDELTLDAALVGDRLELSGENAYVELVRPDARAAD